MRIVKAYQGKYIAYRAWFNGKLIWSYGDDTMGDLVAALNAVAKPEPEVPDAILLQGEANTRGAGLAEVWELDPVLTQTGAGISSNATPRAAETVHPMAAGVINGRATARPYTYGTVFTRGHAPAELSTQAKPNTAEAVRAVGVADFGNIDVASRPRPEEVPRILAAADATIDAPALPVPQEPEGVVMKTSNGLTSNAGVGTLPVHTVTFMYGGKVLYSSSAIHGYSCTDPLTTGDVEKQEKGMTVSHTFEHTGWSLTEDGEPDASVLENITEDIVVYAAFTASIRYYTVRFWDGDTLVDTVSTPYGGTAVTSYTKPGYKATWEPSNENITGDTDCYGQFEEVTFKNSTWAEIAEISESGEASSYFAVGDTRQITVGTTNITLVIIGFDHDTLYDGTGKAGMTIFAQTALSDTVAANSFYSIRNFLTNTVLPQLPSELQAVIKPVNKDCDSSYTSGVTTPSSVPNWKLFPLSFDEMKIRAYGTRRYTDDTWRNYFSELGTPYQYFINKYSSTYCGPRYAMPTGTWLRQWARFGDTSCGLYGYTMFSSGAKSYMYAKTDTYTNMKPVHFAFCI